MAIDDADVDHRWPWSKLDERENRSDPGDPKRQRIAINPKSYESEKQQDHAERSADPQPQSWPH
jgi:hypothetical protein